MSTLIVPQLMYFRAAGLVLSFDSLVAAQKKPAQQQEDTAATTKPEELMKIISLAVDSKQKTNI